MNDLTLIRQPASDGDLKDDSPRVVLRADRVTLAKRRWRGAAEDKRQFGFDLSAPLSHGACFLVDGATRYVIEQEPEAVLEIPIATPEEAAAIAWQIGNLHLGVQVLPSALRVADDPAAAQLLAREHISFQRHTGIFLPRSGGDGHHHHAHAHE